MCCSHSNPLTSLGLFVTSEKAAVYLYLRGMRKSIKGKCFSHKSLLTTSWDHYLIIIVASLHCSPSRPPHLFSLIVRSASLHFPAPSGAAYFSVGGNYSTNGVPLFFLKHHFLMQIITVGTWGSIISIISGRCFNYTASSVRKGGCHLSEDRAQSLRERQ